MHTTFHADEQFSTPSFVRYDTSSGSPDGRVSSALHSLPRALHSSQLNDRSPYLDRSNDSRRYVEGSPSVRRPEEKTPTGGVYGRLFREADEVRARRDVAKEQSVRRELSRCRSAPKISEMGHNIPRDTDIVVRLGNLHKEKKAMDEYKRVGNEMHEQEILDQWFKPAISSKGRRTESKVYKDDLRQSRIAEYERRAEESRHERIQKEIEETYGSPVINPRSEQLARRADAKGGLSGMTRIEAMLERERIAQIEKWERHMENDAMARGAATPQITKYAANMRRDKSAVERLWEDGQNRSKRQEERERERQQAEALRLQEEEQESNKFTPHARRRKSVQRDPNEASPPYAATNKPFMKRSQSGNRSPAPATHSKLSLEPDNTYGNYSNNSAMDTYGSGNERAGDGDVPVLPLPPAPRLQSGSRSMARSDADQAFLARTEEYARRREDKIRQLTESEAKSMHSPLINPVSELIASRLPHSTMERLTAPKRESSSASPNSGHKYQEPALRNDDGPLPRNTPHREYNEVYESSPGAQTESDLEASWGAARSLNARGSNADRIDSRHSSLYDATDENEYSSVGSPKRKKMSAVQRDGDVYQRMANWMQRKEQKLQQLRADLQRESTDGVAGELPAASQSGGRSRQQGASTHSHAEHEAEGPSEYIPSPNRYQPGSSIIAARQASYVSSAPSTLLSPKRQQENLVSPKKDYDDVRDVEEDDEDYEEDVYRGTPVQSTPHANRPHKVLPTEPTTPRGLTVGRDASGTPFTGQFSPKSY